MNKFALCMTALLLNTFAFAGNIDLYLECNDLETGLSIEYTLLKENKLNRISILSREIPLNQEESKYDYALVGSSQLYPNAVVNSYRLENTTLVFKLTRSSVFFYKLTPMNLNALEFVGNAKDLNCSSEQMWELIVQIKE